MVLSHLRLGKERRALFSFLFVTIAGVIAILLLAINVWPLWTGDAIYTGGNITPV
jgi:hypothetical protein